MWVGIIACGVASSTEVHYRIVDFLHLVSMKEALSFLCDNTVDNAFLGAVVERYGISMVFGTSLFEERTSYDVLCCISNAVSL